MEAICSGAEHGSNDPMVTQVRQPTVQFLAHTLTYSSNPMSKTMSSRRTKENMDGCQNYGPFLGTLNNRCCIIIGTPKGTIILTTTHIVKALQTVCSEAVNHRLVRMGGVGLTPRVQVPNNHILSKILTYITTILKPSTSLLGPLDPWGHCFQRRKLRRTQAAQALGESLDL